MELYCFFFRYSKGGSKLNSQGDIVANIKPRKIKTYMYIISVCNYPLSRITWTSPTHVIISHAGGVRGKVGSLKVQFTKCFQ